MGLRFIGPSGDVIRMMGNKSAARDLMKKHHVPVVPGSDGAVETAEEAGKIAAEIGYPVLVKASAGGGGRGMRRVDSPEEMENKFQQARSEAIACFGDGQARAETLPEQGEKKNFFQPRQAVMRSGRPCPLPEKRWGG